MRGASADFKVDESAAVARVNEMRRKEQKSLREPNRLKLLRAPAFGFSLLLLLVFAAVPHARAQEAETQEREQRPPMEGRGRRGGRGGGAELLQRLGLTPDQRSQLQEIRRRNEQETRELMRSLMQARRTLDEAIYAETLDEAAIEQRVREVAAAQAALVRLRATMEVRVRQVLTPEQLQTFRELRQQARLEQQRRRFHDGQRPADSSPPPRRRKPREP